MRIDIQKEWGNQQIHSSFSICHDELENYLLLRKIRIDEV